MDDATGFISVSGQGMGERLNDLYREAFATDELSRSQVETVLVNLKRKIDGRFTLVHEDDQMMRSRNRRCPSDDNVLDPERVLQDPVR